MVSASSSSSSSSSTGASQTYALSAKVRNTIQSIKEIVGSFSDADIYMALQEANMDPNETTQKLLNQDPFHEVKRRRDKKENLGYRGSVDSRKQTEDSIKHLENSGTGTNSRSFPDRSASRGGYTQSSSAGKARVSKQFRVVRDNRVNNNGDRELKPASQQGSASNYEQSVNVLTKKSSSTGISSTAAPSAARGASQMANGPTDSQARHIENAKSTVSNRKETAEEKQTTFVHAASWVQPAKSNSTQQNVAVALSNTVVGVYSSSTDPVHVPSPDSRSPAAIGAIKRVVGVVGGRRQSSDNAAKDSTASSSSFSNSVLGRNVSLSESFRPFTAISKTDQVSATADPAVPSISGNKPFLSNQHSSRSHHAVGHQKTSQLNKEWKPKSSQRSNVSGPGVIGTPTKSSSPPEDNSKRLESEAADLPDKLSQANIHDNQNVIIAQHICVPETDRCRLTFGSFGVEFDASRNFVSGFHSDRVTEETNGESAVSLAASATELSSDNASGSKQVDLLDDQVRNSGSDSPASGEVSEHQLPDESPSTPNLDNYSDIGLVGESSPSYTPSETQQQQDPRELPNFSAYDPQTGYDISYFRSPIDEAMQGQGIPSLQEALPSHTGNNIPASTIPMVQQQQQPPMAQMYPQVHVSHFANLMPYRQFLPPVYVPQMAMPGYSSNPAYPHPPNGSSYLLMPGSSSHLAANGLKYGIQQFKPVPGGSPTGFGNFTNPTGYAINAPGVVGSATGLDDSSRIKYKDGNLFVPNPQLAETSEIWLQNPRELPGMQSAPYYNMPGQTPHAAYLPSHTGHASFNAAAAQSSHMQFPGLYPPPPPQPAAMANPHHLGTVMGGNIGVGAAPGAQVGAYQRPQLGQPNWTPSF